MKKPSVLISFSENPDATISAPLTTRTSEYQESLPLQLDTQEQLKFHLALSRIKNFISEGERISNLTWRSLYLATANGHANFSNQQSDRHQSSQTGSPTLLREHCLSKAIRLVRDDDDQDERKPTHSSSSSAAIPPVEIKVQHPTPIPTPSPSYIPPTQLAQAVLAGNTNLKTSTKLSAARPKLGRRSSSESKSKAAASSRSHAKVSTSEVARSSGQSYCTCCGQTTTKLPNNQNTADYLQFKPVHRTSFSSNTSSATSTAVSDSQQLSLDPLVMPAAKIFTPIQPGDLGHILKDQSNLIDGPLKFGLKQQEKLVSLLRGPGKSPDAQSIFTQDALLDASNNILSATSKERQYESFEDSCIIDSINNDHVRAIADGTVGTGVTIFNNSDEIQSTNAFKPVVQNSMAIAIENPNQDISDKANKRNSFTKSPEFDCSESKESARHVDLEDDWTSDSGCELLPEELRKPESSQKSSESGVIVSEAESSWESTDDLNEIKVRSPSSKVSSSKASNHKTNQQASRKSRKKKVADLGTRKSSTSKDSINISSNGKDKLIAGLSKQSVVTESSKPGSKALQAAPKAAEEEAIKNLFAKRRPSRPKLESAAGLSRLLQPQRAASSPYLPSLLIASAAVTKGPSSASTEITTCHTNMPELPRTAPTLNSDQKDKLAIAVANRKNLMKNVEMETDSESDGDDQTLASTETMTKLAELTARRRQPCKAKSQSHSETVEKLKRVNLNEASSSIQSAPLDALLKGISSLFQPGQSNTLSKQSARSSNNQTIAQ